jgi:hypothetical protein
MVIESLINLLANFRTLIPNWVFDILKSTIVVNDLLRHFPIIKSFIVPHFDIVLLTIKLPVGQGVAQNNAFKIKLLIDKFRSIVIFIYLDSQFRNVNASIPIPSQVEVVFLQLLEFIKEHLQSCVVLIC